MVKTVPKVRWKRPIGSAKVRECFAIAAATQGCASCSSKARPAREKDDGFAIDPPRQRPGAKNALDRPCGRGADEMEPDSRSSSETNRQAFQNGWQPLGRPTRRPENAGSRN